MVPTLILNALGNLYDQKTLLNGLAQALNYAGMDIFKDFPGLRTYYQGLTVHGVFKAIILTFSFSNGFVALSTARGLNRPLSEKLLWAALISLADDVVLRQARED